MPCYDPPWRNDDYPSREEEQVKVLKNRCHRLTAMLCAVLKDVEMNASSEAIEMVLSKKGRCGPNKNLSYNVGEWWEDHKEFDRERRS